MKLIRLPPDRPAQEMNPWDEALRSMQDRLQTFYPAVSLGMTQDHLKQVVVLVAISNIFLNSLLTLLSFGLNEEIYLSCS